MQSGRLLLLSDIRGRDPSPSPGGELLQEDLEPGCDRHADDRPYDPEERSERQHADEHGETRNAGGLSDDRRLQNVVLDLLVDQHHDREDNQRLDADRQRDDPDDDAGDGGPDGGDEVEHPAINARASGYGRSRITAVTP